VNILSIQSHVAYGHVGNSAAVLPLQRRGHTVWPVHTVMLSNHAGYPDFGGTAVPPGELADIVAALDRRGALARCDAVLSGYLGGVEAGEVVLDALARVRRHNPNAVYCCDPVMGDDGAVYVDADIPAFMRSRAARQADILTPNPFELAMLSEIAPAGLDGAPLEQIVAAAKSLLAPPRRTATVLVTSVAHAALAADEVAMLAVTAAGAWLVATPRLAFAEPPHGAGDCCAALFCAVMLETGDAAKALATAANAIYAVLVQTQRYGGGELALVSAQEALAAPPPPRFRANMVA